MGRRHGPYAIHPDLLSRLCGRLDRRRQSRTSGARRRMRSPRPPIIWPRRAGRSDRPWGWEVTLPKDFNKALIGRSKWRTVAEWAKLGVKPARGGNFGAPNADAFVMVPQGLAGPAFLVTRNFLAHHGLQSFAFLCGGGRPSRRPHPGRRSVSPAPGPMSSYDLSFAAARRDCRSGSAGAASRPAAATAASAPAPMKRSSPIRRSAGLPLDGLPSLKLLERIRRGS